MSRWLAGRTSGSWWWRTRSRIARRSSSGLSREGFVVDVAADGPEGLRRFIDHPPDIVLLDLLLPGHARHRGVPTDADVSPVPIVMVSAVGAELDVVLGLELGAAGYVTKPFRLRELVARMQAILRRVSPARVPGARAGTEWARRRPRVRSTRRTADVDLRSGRPSTSCAGRSPSGVDPSTSPAANSTCSPCCSPRSRRVRTREELIDLLWPDRFLSDSRTLDTHIHRLRAKLEPDPAEPRYIVTVRGVGFRLDPDGSRPAPPARHGLRPDLPDQPHPAS